MKFGSGDYSYTVSSDWAKLPAGWSWGWIAAVACDSRDRVYVYSRSEHPLVIFDRLGNFIESWAEDLLKDAHGIFIDAEGNIYCTEWNSHCVHKLDPTGKHLMTLGTPGRPATVAGMPFNKPTDLDIASTGELFVSDGYGNTHVHKFSPAGDYLMSWGKPGTGPGEFALPHCVRIDQQDSVWVCDRTNDRIQIFDVDGAYIASWSNISKPDMIYFDPGQKVVYIAHMDHRVSIRTLTGKLITEWGGGRSSTVPGEFLGCPHGIWVDSRGDIYVSEVKVDGRLQKFVREPS